MKTIKLKKGEITNGSWLTVDVDRLPCIKCDLACEFAGTPQRGHFSLIGANDFTWSVKLELCNDTTLEFDELYIDGERVVFDKERVA